MNEDIIYPGYPTDLESGSREFGDQKPQIQIHYSFCDEAKQPIILPNHAVFTVASMDQTATDPLTHERNVKRLTNQARRARERYHELSPEKRKQLNRSRGLAKNLQRRRLQEEKELERVLTETGDVEPPINPSALKKKRERWAATARARYARMSPEERRQHNQKRTKRNWERALAKAGTTHENEADITAAARELIREQNAEKAERAKARYHSLSAEERQRYNQKRFANSKERGLKEFESFFVKSEGPLLRSQASNQPSLQTSMQQPLVSEDAVLAYQDELLTDNSYQTEVKPFFEQVSVVYMSALPNSHQPTPVAVPIQQPFSGNTIMDLSNSYLVENMPYSAELNAYSCKKEEANYLDGFDQDVAPTTAYASGLPSVP